MKLITAALAVGTAFAGASAAHADEPAGRVWLSCHYALQGSHAYTSNTFLLGRLGMANPTKTYESPERTYVFDEADGAVYRYAELALARADADVLPGEVDIRINPANVAGVTGVLTIDRRSLAVRLSATITPPEDQGKNYSNVTTVTGAGQCVKIPPQTIQTTNQF